MHVRPNIDKSSSKQANHPSQAAKSSNNSSILLNTRSENLQATPPTNERPFETPHSPCPVVWKCREFPQRWKRGSLNTSKTTYTTFAVVQHHIRVHLIVSSSSVNYSSSTVAKNLALSNFTSQLRCRIALNPRVEVHSLAS